MYSLTDERKHNMHHIGFITKRNAKYVLIWNGTYQAVMPGGKKTIVTPGALRKAGWKTEPFEHASEEGKMLFADFGGK